MDVANAVKQAAKGSCGGVIGYWLYGLLNGFEEVNGYYSLALAASISTHSPRASRVLAMHRRMASVHT